MESSKHAEKRMQQRAVSKEVIQRIMEEGEGSPAPGGAIIYQIPEKLRRAQSEYHMRQHRLLEQAAGKAVLAEGGTIITVLPLYRKLSHK